MAMLVGVTLAVGALAYALYPLLAAKAIARDAAPRVAAPAASRDVTDEEIEAAIRSYRERESTGISCPVCGARPELDALYCSSCGRQLPVADAGR